MEHQTVLLELRAVSCKLFLLPRYRQVFRFPSSLGEVSRLLNGWTGRAGLGTPRLEYLLFFTIIPEMGASFLRVGLSMSFRRYGAWSTTVAMGGEYTRGDMPLFTFMVTDLDF